MTTGMMNDTDVEADILGDLEFDPPCGTRTRITIFGWVIARLSCTSKKADWVASAPCCSGTMFVCQKCRDGAKYWCCCGHKFADENITWTRI